tara:strand:- start:93 stop:293 length:201 start_codon:yes stop_codon:yes gene_type:complete
MAIVYKKLKNANGSERTDYICKQVTDGSDNIITDSWIPTVADNTDYKKYLEWEAIDGNTIGNADNV